MKTIYPLLILLVVLCRASAQVHPYGVVDTVDLKLKYCDFEKDANAEVLFNHCIATYNGTSLVMERHKRLKIFSMKNAGELADVSITMPSNGDFRTVSDLQAETFNLENGKIQVVKLDKKSFYKQKVDKWRKRVTFTFPAIKDGSIVEYKYSETINYALGLPDWYFQGDLPVRYSQYDIKVPSTFPFFHKLFITQDIDRDCDSVVAMAKIPSLMKEPYMDSYFNNRQHVSFMITKRDSSGKVVPSKDTWQDLGSLYIFNRYKEPLNLKLKNEDKLVDAVKNMAPEQKLAYIFNKVRDTLTCDDENSYPQDNLAKAWNRRKCSTDDINLILCRLLTQAGLNATLLNVSSDPKDRVIPGDPNGKNLDELVVHVQIAKDKYYVLDASEKKNKWNETPYNMLNTYALYMNVQLPAAGLFFIQDNNKARNVVFVIADILPDGKLKGTAQITNTGYNRIKTIKRYKTDGEKQFTNELRDNDNNLKISSYKINNMEVDTVLLMQNIEFNLESPGADDSYIYISPKLFSGFNTNPFISTKRVSNVDFLFRNNYLIVGHYNIPAGYKVDALPKNVTMMMPDTSIVFKQSALVEDNAITIHYTLDYNRSYFGKDEYSALFEFYRKMYEMLNQQIVLKKE